VTERRPPARPPRPLPTSAGSRPRPADDASDLEDSTILAPRAEERTEPPTPAASLSDDELKTIARRPDFRTSQISLIEAQESRGLSDLPDASGGGFASSDEGGTLKPARHAALPQPSLEGPYFDDVERPATAVLRLAFSEPGEEALPEEASPRPQPVEVRKWKIGGEDARGEEPAAPGKPAMPSAGRARPPALEAPGPLVSPPASGPTGPDDPRAGAHAFALPPTDAEPPAGRTRVDLRSDASLDSAIDVDDLRRTLEEAERLFSTAAGQLASLDLAARGVNAQVAAGLHRLHQALEMLKR
jgi:hypothetical protein